LLVAATGFAPDADHLGVAAGRVLSRISVFDADAGGGGGSKSVDPHRLVREDLSAMMIYAAMSDGGRPLGLQLLVVRTSALSSSPLRRRRTTATTMKEEEDELLSLELYTVDPSGGWRSCAGSGTAVGRGAEGVRSFLLRRRRRRRGGGNDARFRRSGGGGSSSNSTSNDDDAPPLRGWRGALYRAMMASVVALDDRDDGGGTGDDDDDAPRGGGARANHGAVVVFGAPPRRWCAGPNRRQQVRDGRPGHHRGVLRLLSLEARGPKEARWHDVSKGTGIMHGGSVIIWL
jgi:hypothetical protein